MQTKNKEPKNITVKNIQVTDICPSELNPRKTFDQESLAELAQNIKEHGLVQPITIRKRPKGSDTKYEIVCGERRYRATLLNGSPEIQCIIKELDDKQAFAAMIIENLQRKDVDPIEEAAALSKLYANGTMNVADMAKMLGKSTSFVTGRIQLNNIIDEFIQLMRDGTLYLVHLLDICKLTQEQQKKLYEECFSPACIARWTQKILKMEILHDMIDEHVMQFLDTAKFDTKDCSFSCGHDCEGCPLNTKNKPESFKDANRPRCMDSICFGQKTLEHILRTAKESGLTLVYQGEGNEKWITAAGAAGLKLINADDRKYVFEPTMPDESKFSDKECYEKRMFAYRHAKAIFDSNVEDGLVEKVFEVCFDGKLSGEFKWTFSAPKENEDAKESLTKKEQITKLKDQVLKCDEQEHDELIEEKRKMLEESGYSTVNTPLNAEEQRLFHAIIMKRLSYDFKKRIGIEWANNENAYKACAKQIEEHRNAIKREFMKQFLSEKSVCYSHDLAGMLIALCDDQMGNVAELEKSVSEKYDKQRKACKARIDELKGKKTEEPAEEEEVIDTPVEESSVETPLESVPEESKAEDVVVESPTVDDEEAVEEESAEVVEETGEAHEDATEEDATEAEVAEENAE